MSTDVVHTPARPRTIVVTGASRGIGRDAALRFAAEGDRLVLAARGLGDLEDVADECRRAGAADVVATVADIGDPAAVEALFGTAVDRFGQIDVVVQNASVAAFGRITDVPSEVFEAVVKINILGAADVSRRALRQFRTQGHGHLVVVGSLLGHAAVPLMGPYVISKFAVTALVRILRQETRGDRGISVHGVYPGAVDTAIYPLSANYFGRLARVLPVNDGPDKIARAIFAASHSRRAGEAQVGIANRPMLLAYRTMPRLFDAMVGPLMRTLSFTRQQLAPTSGNVLDEVTPSHRLD